MRHGVIAHLTYEHRLLLVHNDRDFDHIAGVEPSLKCAPSAVQH